MVKENPVIAIESEIYSILNQPSLKDKKDFIHFLYAHLEEYGDKKEDIEKAYDYAMMSNNSYGGFVITATYENKLAGVAIINKTGMEGYIPENILVYIATHKKLRGKGIGKKLMSEIVESAEGNIALHVEPDNPAIHLYKQFGFTNKYLEMRLNKKENKYGIRNA